MSATKKIESIASFTLEPGKLISGTTINAFSFGGSNISSLGAGLMIPYDDISGKGISENDPDESIDGQAARDLPVQKKIGANLESWGGAMRYLAMDRLLYWMFGYEDGGSSPQNLGSGIYSHLFELDSHERNLASYRTAEKTAVDYNMLDRKNRYACLGIKRGTNDFRYPFLLCGGFGFSSTAGEALKWTAKGPAYREDRSDYSSGSWTLAAGLGGSANKIMHHHLTLSLAPASGAFVDLAVTDVNVSVDIPLLLDQDSESGKYIAEPVMNGKYGVDFNFTLSRHAVDTYLQYRDNFQEVFAKLVYTSGDYEFGLYLPSMVINDSAPTGDDVARLPIAFSTAKEPSGGNPFVTEVGDHDIIQAGPLFCITKNTNSTNEMRRA